MAGPDTAPTRRDDVSDRLVGTTSGYAVLVLGLLVVLGAVYLAWNSFGSGPYGGISFHVPGLALAAVLLVGQFVMLTGLYSLQPNQSGVIVLFGRYVGTDTAEGLRWTNPFADVSVVSRRIHSFETSILKVNDGNGNPVEVAAAVMWYVHDAARAKLQVEDHVRFVEVQSEASVRTMTSSHPYDHHDEPEAGVTDAPAPRRPEGRVPSLLGDNGEISRILTQELSERLAVAGIVVDEARLTHLAYAPEIAPAMLRRQQAQAVVAAKRKIVEGAVGIVKDAMSQLKDGELPVDETRRAALVSNLLVVLVADREVTPVVNAGYAQV